ncbi:aromatic prenyl transferase [Metarhizium rileyi]|uniref:Aromatic prenyl transferase n=1 Tax=Metarhizium rileyi (strain RCEF 4871) TaxID=1649241 RepID=A0A166WLL2_METRR|nr:aromatic prenyl transferase [Metarhizium rileyi RCEF 4871]
MADQTPTQNNVDLSYWMHHAVPPLLALLRATGTYSAAEQGEHIRFLCDNVLPHLGPRPTKDSPANSPLTPSGSPLDLSLNLDAGRPMVRYCWEPMGAESPKDGNMYTDGTLRRCLASLSAELGFSRRWCDALMDALVPTTEEANTAQQNIQAWQSSQLPPGVTPRLLTRLPFSALAFNLDGSRTSAKFYLSPTVKEMGSGKSMNETVWNVLRRLQPPISEEAIKTISQFLQDIPGLGNVGMVSVDLVKEEELSRARVKIYISITSNSFNTVRQCMTVGGLRQDETTLEGLEILRSIWHLLLQEEEAIADDYETPVKDVSKMAAKLFLCLDVTPGQDLPSPKLHVPVFNYLKSDAEALRNFETILQKCNQGWAAEGKHRAAFETAFGDPSLDRGAPIHSYTSFSYGKSGVYQTLYFSLPTGME